MQSHLGSARRNDSSVSLINCICISLAFAICPRAAVLRVGTGQPYPTPCSAIGAASPGDIVEVDAVGDYDRDGCGWSTNDLTIVGVNGRPRIDAAGLSFRGRAIWIISGNNTTIENIEFANAKGPYSNGAAILQFGTNLTVRKCYIHNNEDGILAGANPSSHILIENTEFAENGYKDGQAHNIYIGTIGRFTLRFSYSHDAISGHLVKSRALQNFILYNRLTGESGTSSFELDLPNGGLSYVIGNVIEQGPLTENSTIVAYGLEGVTNPNSTLYFVNNTVVNNRRSGFFLKIGGGAAPPVLQNNIFSGGGLVIDQPGAKVSHNLSSGALFVDSGEYNYLLQPSSPARDYGVNPGVGSGFPLTPNYQYVHPTCFELRRMTGRAIDAGAFEIGGGSGADSSCAQPIKLSDLTFSPANVEGGQTTKGTLRLQGVAPEGGISVAVSSSDPSVASVAATIIVPPGNNSAHLKVTTLKVSASTPVVISVEYGHVVKSVALEVTPLAPTVSSVVFSARSIVGGKTITGTVTLANPSPTEETALLLTSTPAGVVTVPPRVIVPAGANRASFSIKVANVAAGTVVNISAINLSGGNGKTASLTVTPQKP